MMDHVAAPRIADLVDGGGITADMLRATFDHWRIFEKNGRWWATRPGAVTSVGPESLIHPVVCGMTLGGLAEQLCMQEWLRRMPPAELESVWREGFAAVAS